MFAVLLRSPFHRKLNSKSRSAFLAFSQLRAIDLFGISQKGRSTFWGCEVQNRQQLNRLGFDDDSESRQFIQTHLEQAVQEESNIVERFINTYTNHTTGEEATIDTELRDSLLPGRTGKFAQVQSSWEVLPDGTRRFLSAIIYGK
ncbi:MULTISPECIES: hypothetical protein [unclassified Microcoleus]|uniref:hypothetical protein n=1 Tax=unclassified Microcoleus TaxID=2642155 RepID=UPI002FD71BA6